MRDLFTGYSVTDYRRGRRDFSRGGAINGEALVAFLLFLVADGGTRGYALLLDAFRDQARTFGGDPAAFECSAAAWCDARRKLDSAFVRGLVHRAADAYDARYRPARPRRFAVDGSKLNIRRAPANQRTFGVPEGAHCPQVLISTLYDIDTLVPHDVVVAPYATSEREELVRLLDRVRPGDTLVLDRGYPSFELLRILTDAGIRFVMRVPTTSSFAAIQPFLRGPVDDALVAVDPPYGHVLTTDGPVDVRIIRSTVPGHGPLVLLASPAAPDETAEDIVALYRRRWEIEEYYKIAKSDYFGQGQLHAKSPEGVRQEIYAQALYIALSRYLMTAAATARDQEPTELSPKAAVLAVADHLTRILILDDHGAATLRLIHLLERLRTPKQSRRRGRKFARRSYKPSPKWGPLGRRGG